MHHLKYIFSCEERDYQKGKRIIGWAGQQLYRPCDAKPALILTAVYPFCHGVRLIGKRRSGNSILAQIDQSLLSPEELFINFLQRAT